VIEFHPAFANAHLLLIHRRLLVIAQAVKMIGQHLHAPLDPIDRLALLRSPSGSANTSSANLLKRRLIESEETSECRFSHWGQVWMTKNVRPSAPVDTGGAL